MYDYLVLLGETVFKELGGMALLEESLRRVGFAVSRLLLFQVSFSLPPTYRSRCKVSAGPLTLPLKE